MDLTKSFPRSPRATLMGLPMLPRTIDKARASIDGTLGEYVFGEKSSFDMALLDFLAVKPDVFREGVRASVDDAAVESWVKANARTFTPDEAAVFARVFTNDGDDDADRARFQERRAKLPAHVQPRVTGWVDLLDVAEDRIA
ncbi:MAG TPA: DUF5069 domain-containing protein [Candidatus Eremiobacteraceae bacterium]